MNIGEIILKVHPGLGGWDTFNAHINDRMANRYMQHQAASGFFCIDVRGKGY